MKILDMSAGARAVWFDKNYPGAVYVDIRPQVKPDIVADTRALPAEVGTGFDLVLFDPPHKNFGANSNMSKNYGHHTSDEIRDIIRRSAAEAHRVSKPNALMAFKWSSGNFKLQTALDLMSAHWQPLFGHGVNHQQRRGVRARCPTPSARWPLMKSCGSRPSWMQPPRPSPIWTENRRVLKCLGGSKSISRSAAAWRSGFSTPPRISFPSTGNGEGQMPEPKDTDLCHCGHVRDEHAQDHSCVVTGCDCIHFEHDQDADEGDGPFTTDEVE